MGDVALGVDVGGTKVLGVALAERGEVLRSRRLPTPRSGGLSTQRDPNRRGSRAAIVEAVREVVAELIDGLEGSGGVERGGATTLGVGAPGMIDAEGRVRLAPNLPGVEGANLAELLNGALAGSLSSPVVVVNDANCAAVGELSLGAARGFEEALIVTLGTGIGGGVVSGGRVRTGVNGFAGEVGHMKVDRSGPPCPCGQRGCWERFASGDGLGRLAREAAYGGRLASVVECVGGDPEAVRGEDVTAAAFRGDAEAIAVVAELGWWVALGLANLSAILDPEIIVIGGGLIEAGETLLTPTRSAFAQLLEGGAIRSLPDIVPALLGERAGAVGAAIVGRRGSLS